MSRLVLEGVSKAYRGVPALPEVHVNVAAGEALGLWGPTGCGKSTLLRIVAGLELPDHGRIAIEGAVANDPAAVMPPEARGVGFAFQDLALWPHMSARGHLEYALGASIPARSDRRRGAEKGLGDLNLLTLSDRRPHELSRGEGQRLAFARALCNAPRILLLDEPVASQDASMCDVMLDQVRERLDAGAAALIASHDPAVIARVAHRVAVLEGGACRIVSVEAFMESRAES